MAEVWLGLGSNIGDRLFHIENAITELGISITGLCRASLYETAPRDYTEQADFLNTVVRGVCELEPGELLDRIQQIENSGGRNRSGSLPKGPRTIDIDILMIDNQVEDYNFGEGLTLSVPHISMHERLFVLKPLLDISPDSIDPRDSVSWSRKASHLIDQRVKLYTT